MVAVAGSFQARPEAAEWELDLLGVGEDCPSDLPVVTLTETSSLEISH